jgi:hypothetical protein
MQQYAISGDWEREGRSKRLLEWTDSETDAITGWFEVKGRRIRMFTSDDTGRPEARIASGRVEQPKLLRSLDDGFWGSNPAVMSANDSSPAVVDVWGNRINKLASLVVTNEELYNTIFGV